MRSPFVMITAVRRQVAWYDFEVYCFCCFLCCEAFTFVNVLVMKFVVGIASYLHLLRLMYSVLRYVT